MDEMIEELKKDIVIYEQATEDLETGKIREGWMDANGSFKDNSAWKAEQYRKVAAHFRVFVQHQDQCRKRQA